MWYMKNSLLVYLEQKNTWVSKSEIFRHFKRQGYVEKVIEKGLKQIEWIANIGIVWNREHRRTEYRWYSRREPEDTLMQQALDNFNT